MIKDILLCGGTHGNEWTGVYVVKNEDFSYETLNISKILTNPLAYENRVRYLEKDLNRCFLPDELGDSRSSNKEQAKAKDLLKEIQNADLVIDLHTTTSNMGPTLILAHEDDFLLQIAANAQKIYPDIKIIKEIGDQYLISRAKYGFIVEVGPCAQNVLSAQISRAD